MVFKRKIYDELLNWKQQDNGTTAALIQGARRVGKSTIAEEFLFCLQKCEIYYILHSLIQKGQAMKSGRDIGKGFQSGGNRSRSVYGLHLTPPYMFLICRDLGNLTNFHPPTYLCRSKADLYYTAPSMAGTVFYRVRTSTEFLCVE